MWAFAPVPWIMTAIHLLVENRQWHRRSAKATVLLASIVVWTLLALWLESNYEALFDAHFETPIATFCGIVLLVIAVTVEIATARALGRKRILGSSEFGNAQDGLVTDGISRYARHPRYVEHPLWFVGLGLTFGYPSMIWFGLYLLIALATTARFEERELAGRYGEEYLRYAKRTPAFFIGTRD